MERKTDRRRNVYVFVLSVTEEDAKLCLNSIA